MAARLKAKHQDDIRSKIQTSQLINRLNNHIDGSIELSSTQIDAAKFLINKTMSNAPTITDNKTELTGNLKFEVIFGKG